VSLTISDVLGRVVSVLVNEEKHQGFYSAFWDAPAGSSGVFFYSIRSQQFSETKKMILVR
jgi:hypothetical protein